MENPPNSWSELPLDLLNSVFERLGFADFQRGKSVCSSWHSASRQSVPKNQIPWVIFFPQDKSNNSCTLFNPEEKDKLYQIQDLGADFGKSVCKATYGSWLLMRDPLYNLYIVNVFTKEKINLPPVESQLGTTKIERTLEDHMFLISNDKKKHMSRGISISAPVFWIDDKTKDYVVIWELGRWCLLYSKRGDDFWNQIPEPTNYFDLVYKDHKLYFSCHQGTFGIYDFSGEIPQQTFFGNLNRDFPPDRSKTVIIYTKLVVTLTGDVLRVVRRLCRWRRTSYFYVYKVYSSGSLMYERVHSLGNEAMLFDLGITVLANDTTGLKKNSIYFNIGPYSYVHDATEMFLFNLQTRKMEPQHEFDSSSFQLKTARWFLPSFIRKCLV